MKIEIAWIVGDDNAQIKELKVAEGSSILFVLQEWREEVDWPAEFSANHLAVWQQSVQPSYIVKEQDRIEWVKPLLCDPKVARMQRLKNKKC